MSPHDEDRLTARVDAAEARLAALEQRTQRSDLERLSALLGALYPDLMHNTSGEAGWLIENLLIAAQRAARAEATP
jgi:hypothetical protein